MDWLDQFDRAIESLQQRVEVCITAVFCGIAKVDAFVFRVELLEFFGFFFWVQRDTLLFNGCWGRYYRSDYGNQEND